jgi:hypothetical protein
MMSLGANPVDIARRVLGVANDYKIIKDDIKSKEVKKHAGAIQKRVDD